MQMVCARRFWVGICILCAVAANAATLTWTGTQSREWNTVHSNWAGGLVFQSGDAVRFGPGANNIFIGLDGIPGPVSPSAVWVDGTTSFSGGDILTGSIRSDGSLTFSNAQSLSFPDGLVMARELQRLTYEVSAAPNLERLRLGLGSIEFSPQCSLSVQVGHGKGIELENDVIFGDRCQLVIEPFFQRTNGTVRFTGNISFKGFLTVDNAGGNSQRPPGTPGPFPDALAGQLVLWQENTRQLMMFLNGWYGHRPFEISGAIVDGTGTASNRLEFQNYGMFAFRITGTNNTYRHGTYIQSSPSAPKAAIEVAPDSSLGIGDVLVEGLLHLRGAKNIHSNAAVRITQGGQVRLDEGVIVRVKTLQLGGALHTSGRFSSNNAPGYIAGGGEFRVGPNARPTLTVIQPPNSVYAGSDVTFQAMPNDPDGRITKVVFTFFEAVVVREITNAPWTVTVTNVAHDLWYMFAFAYDDEGLYANVGLRDVRVLQPPAPEIRNARVVDANNFAFDFEALASVKYSLELRSDLLSGTWLRSHSLQGSGTVSVTNPIPATPAQNYFRIRAGHQ